MEIAKEAQESKEKFQANYSHIREQLDNAIDKNIDIQEENN